MLVAGPILWLLIANVFLKEFKNLDFTLNTFAYDFNFVFSGGRLLVFEVQAARALSAFCQLLDHLNLQLSTGNSQTLTFKKLKNSNASS